MPTFRAILFRWLPPLLWMALIFRGSSDTLSGEHTSRFIIPFLHWLMGGHFTLERAETIHLLIRKAGHLTEYTILCVLFWRALGTFQALSPVYSLPRLASAPRRRFLVAVALSALYAASDEFHQSFIPSRTASFHDVVIDTFGATLGLAIFLALLRPFRRRPTPPPQAAEPAVPG